VDVPVRMILKGKRASRVFVTPRAGMDMGGMDSLDSKITIYSIYSIRDTTSHQPYYL